MSAEATRVAAAPPPAASTNLTPDIGLGRTDKQLPPLPPPPKSLPLTTLNPTQVVLRAAIVIGVLYLLFLLGRTIIDRSASQACNTPGSEMLKFCQ